MLQYGQDLLRQFPSVPESQAIRQIIEHVQFKIKQIESEQVLSNIVDTVAYLALDNDKLAQIARQLRHPEARPQSDKTMVLEYARNVLKMAQDLLKDFPSVAEAVPVRHLVEDVQFRIKQVESQQRVAPLVDTIAELVLDNDRLARYERRLRTPEARPQDDKLMVLGYNQNALQFARSLAAKLPDDAEVKRIVTRLEASLKAVQSQAELSGIVDTVATVVLLDREAHLIAKKHAVVN